MPDRRRRSGISNGCTHREIDERDGHACKGRRFMRGRVGKTPPKFRAASARTERGMMAGRSYCRPPCSALVNAPRGMKKSKDTNSTHQEPSPGDRLLTSATPRTTEEGADRPGGTETRDTKSWTLRTTCLATVVGTRWSRQASLLSAAGDEHGGAGTRVVGSQTLRTPCLYPLPEPAPE